MLPRQMKLTTQLVLVFWLFAIICFASNVCKQKSRPSASRLLCSSDLKPHELWKIMRANLPPLDEMLPDEADYIRTVDIIMSPTNKEWASELFDMSSGSRSVKCGMRRIKCQRLRHLISVFGIPSPIPVVKEDVAQLLVQSITNCHVYQQSPKLYRLPGQQRPRRKSRPPQDKTTSPKETVTSRDQDGQESSDDLLEMVEEAMKCQESTAYEQPQLVSCMFSSLLVGNVSDKVIPLGQESPVSPLAEGARATVLDEMSAASFKRYEAAAKAALESNVQMDSWPESNSGQVAASEALRPHVVKIKTTDAAGASRSSTKASPKRKADAHSAPIAKKRTSSKPPVPLYPILTIGIAISSEFITSYVPQFLLPQFDKLKELVYLLESNADKFSKQVQRIWKHGERSCIDDCLFIELLFRLGVFQRHEIIPETLRDRLFSWLNKPFFRSHWDVQFQETQASVTLPFQLAVAASSSIEEDQESCEGISEAAALRFTQNLTISMLSLSTRISVDQLLFCLDLLRQSFAHLVSGVHRVLQTYASESDIKSYLFDLHIYIPEYAFGDLHQLAKLLVEHLCQNTLYLTLKQTGDCEQSDEPFQEDSKCEWFPICPISSETSNSHDDSIDHESEELSSECPSLDVGQLGDPIYLSTFDEFWNHERHRSTNNIAGMDADMADEYDDLLLKEPGFNFCGQKAAVRPIDESKDHQPVAAAANPDIFNYQSMTEACIV